MKEIIDKELEQAAGGAKNLNGAECDQYVSKYEDFTYSPEYQDCLTCANYERSGITNICHAGQSYIRKRRYY